MTHTRTANASAAAANRRQLRAPDIVLVLAASLSALAGGTAMATPRMKLVDECLEASFAGVRLPRSSVGRSIDVPLCDGCTTMRLTFTAETRFLVGMDSVPYAQWLKVAEAPGAEVRACYQPDTNVVTRLKVAAPAVK
ncbi:MAG: hypothetical protein IT483_05990 [Gammaproteobacteria bacterium]|nr:hypothetical protein [Gammaproteobacteria bacterium]